MRNIPIPNKLSIAEDYESLLGDIKDFIEENAFKKVFFSAGEFTQKKLIKSLITDLGLQLSSPESADLIIGAGGGRSLDKAKLLAKTHNKSLASIPTLIAHDGICSPVAVIDGKSSGALMPEALFVPLYLVIESPIEHIKAGIGDLISNLSAIEDWKLAHAKKKEKIDDFAIMLSRRAAMNVIKSLEQLNSEEDLKEKNFLKSLIESLALSGIAMSISGNSRPCSGSEHMISHAIDEIYGSGVKASHGIQVLVATLYLEELRGYDLLDNTNNRMSSLRAERSNPLVQNSRLKSILSKYNFPLSFTDIGIQETELVKIMELAPRTRPGRFSFLDFTHKY